VELSRLTSIATWVTAAALLSTHPAGAERGPALPPDAPARLARYDVLSFVDPGGGGIDRSSAVGVFDATPDEVFRTATDYDKLYQFAPRLRLSRVIERPDGAHALVALRSDLPWPARDAWVEALFQVERLASEAYRVRFWQVRGSMRRYTGSILIEPWGAQKSSVTYEVLAEPDTFAPRSLINRKLRDVAAGYVHALRQRINDLHRTGRLHPQQPPAPEVPSMLAGARPPAPVEHLAERR